MLKDILICVFMCFCLGKDIDMFLVKVFVCIIGIGILLLDFEIVIILFILIFNFFVNNCVCCFVFFIVEISVF